MSRFGLDILPLLVAAIALIAGCTTTPVSELPPTATVEEPTMARPAVFSAFQAIATYASGPPTYAV